MSSPPAQATPSGSPSPTKETSQQSTVLLCLPSGCAAKAIFQPEDAHLIACDTKGDWRAAVAVYTRSDAPGEKKVWASNTHGTCTDEPLGMPDGATITYKVCIGDQSENRIDTCSEEVTNTVTKRQ
jgi:hypothetical protein